MFYNAHCSCLNSFLRRMGFPTEDDINTEAREKFKEYIRELHNLERVHMKTYEGGFNAWLVDNKEESWNRWRNQAKNKVSKRYEIIFSKDDFIEFLGSLIEPSLSAENMFKELSKTIKTDYFSGHKKPAESSILAKINGDYLSTNKGFKYLLHKPNKNLEYELEFYNKNKNNSNEIVTFKDLSTGERALFELLYCKYSYEK